MRISEIMKARRVTIAELARIMGVTPGAVVSIINGNPTANNLKKIAAALGCRVGEFFEDEEPSPCADDREGQEVCRDAVGVSDCATAPSGGNFSEVQEPAPARSFEGSGLGCRCPHCGGAVALGLFRVPVGVFKGNNK